MKTLLNHTSFETAYRVEDYPYGFRLRTSIFYWLETESKKGDRFCSCTINPKNGSLNKPKKSTYSCIGFMFLDEKNYVQWDGLGIYSSREEIKTFIDKIGEENLNIEQKKQYNSLMGINEVRRDEFTDLIKKDFSVKWDRETIGNGWVNGVWNAGEKGKYIEVKITFDRPDGVSLKEIYKAMKSLNQERVNEVFAIRESSFLGNHAGIVRICVRGGVMIGTVGEDGYREYLASDANVLEEEAAL